MGKFRILSHARLQEWVAEESGYFKQVGLDYEFRCQTGRGLVRPCSVYRVGAGGNKKRRLRIV